MHIRGHAKAGFYPTPPRILHILASFAQPAPSGGILFDPCAGEGASAALARAWNLCAWGIELHAGRAAIAKRHFDRLLHSDAFAVTITRPSASVLFLNPPYGELLIGGRQEPRWLSFFSSVLVTRGLLILVVQTATMPDLAPWLAQHYRSLAFYRFPEPEYREFGQGVVIGIKRSNAGASENHIEEVRQAAAGDLPILAPVPAPLFELPDSLPQSTLTFTTSWFDPDQLCPTIERSIWTHPRAKALLSLQQPIARARPLLPVQTGHLAQLLMAGMLNNTVVETDSHRYLIKGAAIKCSEVRPPIVTDDKEIIRTVEYFRPRILAWDLQEGETFGRLLEVTFSPASPPQEDQTDDGTETNRT
ncbi:MAG: hypothetical protein D6690_14735 [Nitrospirae bacterium]|nr:MAG: hypothetical protein D6690_14735 [Nitrospirota bacterium]